MDPQIDVKTLVKRRDEFNKKMASASVGAAPTMKIFLRRATYHIVNQSSIPTLLERIERGQDSEDGSEDALKAKHARTLMRYAAKHLPILFKQHQALLNQTIAEEDKTLVTAAALQALASLTRADPASGTSDKCVASFSSLMMRIDPATGALLSGIRGSPLGSGRSMRSSQLGCLRIRLIRLWLVRTRLR